MSFAASPKQICLKQTVSCEDITERVNYIRQCVKSKCPVDMRQMMNLYHLAEMYNTAVHNCSAQKKQRSSKKLSKSLKTKSMKSLKSSRHAIKTPRHSTKSPAAHADKQPATNRHQKKKKSRTRRASLGKD